MDQYLVLNTVSYHSRPSSYPYEWNENNWGLGYQSKYEVQSDGMARYAIGITLGILKDSHYYWMPYGGGFIQRRLSADDWDFDVGGAFLLNRRKKDIDFDDDAERLWNLILTPVVSITYGRSSLNLIYVPAVGKFSKSSTLFLQYAFRFNTVK